MANWSVTFSGNDDALTDLEQIAFERALTSKTRELANWLRKQSGVSITTAVADSPTRPSMDMTMTNGFA